MNAKSWLTRISILVFLATLAACGGGDGSVGTAGTTPPSSGTQPPPSNPGSSPGTVDFFATFPYVGPLRSNPNPVVGYSDDGWWWVEQKAPGRATVVNVGRDGSSGLRLHTDPGDNNVSGSDANERNDVALQYMNGVQGQESWWAHSILFPDDYAIPMPGGRGVVFDFHDTRNMGGQANFIIFVEANGRLTFQGHGGPSVITDVGNQFDYGADVGPLAKNVWYDFVYHVKWSWNDDGYFQAWVNGVKKLDHRGPTLYQDYGVILKLANYHTASGQSSSVIHDRVVRGTTWQVVSLSGLEGVQ